MMRKVNTNILNAPLHDHRSLCLVYFFICLWFIFLKKHILRQPPKTIPSHHLGQLIWVQMLNTMSKKRTWTNTLHIKENLKEMHNFLQYKPPAYTHSQWLSLLPPTYTKGIWWCFG